MESNNFIDKNEIKLELEDYHTQKDKFLRESNYYLITTMIEQLKESLIDTDDLGEKNIKEIILNILREIDEDLDSKIEINEKEGRKKLNKKKQENNLKEKMI